MPLASGPTIGRQDELTRLDELLDRLGGGVGGPLVVEGEPGIGKTRMLRELRQRANERGHLVLTGTAAEFERDVPYGVWVDSLDAYVAARELNGDDPLLDPLSLVLPCRRSGSERPDELIAEERYRAHRAVRRLLDMLAEEKPLVLVLDDLHWADPASIELIGALLRRDFDGPVLLALAVRSGQGSARLRAALSGSEATLLELTRLTHGQSAELLGGRVEGADLGTIVRESRGNPFFALQLARAAALPGAGEGERTSGVVGGVPAGVADALLLELAALSEPGRGLIDAAAIVGDPFELDLAQRVAELDPSAAMDALDELLEVGLLVETDVPRRFGFRHPLVRRAVHESTRAGWRLSAHARAAAILGELGASAGARAHHVEQSAPVGDEQAVAVLLEAAEAAKARSPVTAARWYGAALRLLPQGQRERRLSVLVDLASVQRSVGDKESCCDALAEAVEIVPEEDTPLRVDLIGQWAEAEVFLARHQEAERRLADIADELDSDESPPGVRVLLARSAVAFFTSRHEEAIELAERATAAARALADPGLTGEAAAALAHTATVQGDLELGLASHREAAELLGALSDNELAPHLDAMHRLSRASLHLELYEDAVRIAGHGVDVSTRTGRGESIPVLRSTFAQASLMLGRIPDAEAAQEAAIEAARLQGNDYTTCGILSTTANIALLKGDLEAALRAGEESVSILGPGAEGHVLSIAKAALAVTMREAGRSAAEAEHLTEPVGGWSLEGLPAIWRVRHHEALTRIELADGNVDAAAEHARLAGAGAAELGLPVTAAVAGRAQAAVALARGDHAAAAELAAGSAAAAEERGARVEAASSRALQGRAAAAGGDKQSAIELLRGAETELSASGALHPRNEVRRELRRLGARAEPRGPAAGEETGLASLSTREREVAELVGRHKTNPDIASELYLSVKTIESHLRNVFFKLGVSSRREVAAIVERERAA